MKRIFNIVTYVGAAAVGALALITCIDVTGRYLFNFPLKGGFEISSILLCVIAACGIAEATASEAHISVDSIFERLSWSGQRILSLLSLFLGLLVFLVLTWQGIVAVYDSMVPYYDKTAGSVEIITFPFRILLSAGFLLSAVWWAKQLYFLIRKKDNKPERQ